MARVAPPPPRRNKPPHQADERYNAETAGSVSPMGNHMKMMRQLSPPSVTGFDNQAQFDQNTQQPYSAREDYSQPPTGGSAGINEYDIPETTIGKTVSMKGDISFSTLLRIDGSFEGKLTSNGNLIIGTEGKLVGDIIGMNEVLCRGHVIGNIQVEVLELKSGAQVYGNITAKKLTMEGGVTVVGSLNVNPYAPERVNTKGELVMLEEELTAAIPLADSVQKNSELAQTPMPKPAPSPAPEVELIQRQK